MKYLNSCLISVYVVLIILLLLSTCERPKKDVVNEGRKVEDVIPAAEEEEEDDDEEEGEEEFVKSAGEDVKAEEVEELPTCEEGCERVNNSEVMIVERPFNMGAASGEFVLNWETFSIADQILVYNCLPRQIPDQTPIFDSGMIATSEKQITRISYDDGPVITIVGKTGSPSGSSWWYCLECVN